MTMRKVSLYKIFLGSSSLMLVGKIFTLLSAVLLARILGPEDFGIFTYIISIVTILTIPTTAGLQDLIVREVSYYKVRARFDYIKGMIRWSKVHNLCISGIIIICTFTIYHFGFVKFELWNYLIFAILLVPLNGQITNNFAILNSWQRPILAQFVHNFLSPLLLLLLVVFIYFSPISLNVEFAIYSQLITKFLTLAIISYISFNLLRRKLSSVNYRADYRKWYSAILPFSMFAVVSTLNTEVITIVLGVYKSSEDVAFFKVAQQGFILLNLPMQSINAIIAPKIANFYKTGDLKSIQKIIRDSAFSVTMITIVFLFIIVIFGQNAIYIVFGREYLDAYAILVILSFAQLYNVACGSAGVLLNMTGNERISLKILFLTLIITLISGSILIPIFGAIGAAWSVFISVIMWNSSMVYVAYTKLGIKSWFRFTRGK